jgi:hypothetical protein
VGLEIDLDGCTEADTRDREAGYLLDFGNIVGRPDDLSLVEAVNGAGVAWRAADAASAWIASVSASELWEGLPGGSVCDLEEEVRRQAPVGRCECPCRGRLASGRLEQGRGL